MTNLTKYQVNVKTGKYICPHCGREFSKYGIGIHTWRVHTEEGQKFDPNKGYKCGTRHAWNKGLIKETSEKVRKNGETLRKNYLEGITKPKPHPQTEETRKKLSEITKQRIRDGWSPKAGRAPKYKYTKKDGRVVALDGSWELKVAEYFDNLNIDWERNTKRFPYINLKGKDATYCPDFYLPSKDLYIEVKGYTTDLDRCKWSQFSEKLEVWARQELMQLGILEK